MLPYPHRLGGKGPGALAYFPVQASWARNPSKKVSGKTHGAERPIQGPPHTARPEEFRISKTGG
jgi:hypothetical protein